jgi:PEP-CTERM motif
MAAIAQIHQNESTRPSTIATAISWDSGGYLAAGRLTTMANTSYSHGTAILMAIATLASGTALGASPIPAAEFTFDVSQGGTVVSGCMPHPTLLGGTCGSETSGPGFAATSGGIGTASYLPVTPGGTVLGTGTAVDALSNWTSGGGVHSTATMTYSFEATGPSSVDLIPIDVISKGLVDLVGNSTAALSLTILDQGPNGNIPHGVHDPDPPGPLLDLSAKCSHGKCTFDSWGSAPDHELTNLLCVVNGDNYVLTIKARTTAGAGSHGTQDLASAVLDPVLKLDPPTQPHCPITVDPSLLKVTTGPGASTGVPSGVPEPSTLSLAAFAAIGLVFAARRRASVRSSSQR